MLFRSLSSSSIVIHDFPTGCRHSRLRCPNLMVQERRLRGQIETIPLILCNDTASPHRPKTVRQRRSLSLHNLQPRPCALLRGSCSKDAKVLSQRRLWRFISHQLVACARQRSMRLVNRSPRLTPSKTSVPKSKNRLARCAGGALARSVLGQIGRAHV